MDVVVTDEVVVYWFADGRLLSTCIRGSTDGAKSVQKQGRVSFEVDYQTVLL